MKLINAEQLNSKLFGESENYQRILNMARKGDIPFVKINNRVFFDYETVVKHLENKMQDSVKPEVVNGIRRID